MKIKIPLNTKKIRLPRLNKKARLLLGTGVVILLLILGMYLHILPSPGTIPHFFEPRVTAAPLTSLNGADTALSTPLSPPLIADFLAAPVNQSDPLTVQFFDLSRGNPSGWTWDFGDNSSSSLPSPVHHYAVPGTYNATLIVSRGDGATRTVTAYDVLDTRQSAEMPVLVDTIRNGVIKKGSFLSFVSADDTSSVTVNGVKTTLPSGSRVKIRANADTTGTLSLRSTNILGCSLADATLFVNGAQAARGSFSDCLVPSVSEYHANLTFAIEPTYGEVRQVQVNGSRILAGPDNSYIVVSQDTQNPRNDLTIVAGPGYYGGSASSFSVSPALIAGFIATSATEGDAPLNVSFMDRSAGAPDSWSWDFGDGTSSRDQNPTHLYSAPGVYDVSLTVETQDQSDTATIQSEVIVTPPRLVANFSAQPISGTAPLTVRFTDLSSGSPTSWNWTFQEVTNISFLTIGTVPYATSGDQNPVITFTDQGIYNVWLTANNIYGSSDLLRAGYIEVSAPYNITTNDIVIKTGKPGHIEQGSSLQFMVSNTPAALTINGTYHILRKGDIVRIVADSNQQGDITIDSMRILTFTFPDMAVYVNGDLLDKGEITSIYVPSMTQFQTGLTYYFSPDSAQTYEEINGQPYLSSLDNAWIRIYSLGLNEGGTLSLISGPNTTYIEGGMNQTVQDWILQ
ncbi:PKD domain-containing protein [Methanoregula sp.]|uniref:PKD domain-containing protein n=1 Tax=Methanoregula sp. TaxID=2052170 RepID=UPI002CE97EDE|nr:PKD domain-containing protein [Methanoregula sp.]HVP97030.1 PKD domain-containing protein [Methanoregula sp.]